LSLSLHRVSRRNSNSRWDPATTPVTRAVRCERVVAANAHPKGFPPILAAREEGLELLPVSGARCTDERDPVLDQNVADVRLKVAFGAGWSGAKLFKVSQ
jgi:hypothetical protein